MPDKSRWVVSSNRILTNWQIWTDYYFIRSRKITKCMETIISVDLGYFISECDKERSSAYGDHSIFRPTWEPKLLNLELYFKSSNKCIEMERKEGLLSAWMCWPTRVQLKDEWTSTHQPCRQTLTRRTTKEILHVCKIYLIILTRLFQNFDAFEQSLFHL